MKIQIHRTALFFLALVLFLATGGSAWGQNATGRVLGSVLDQQGGAVAGANVTVINTGTGVGSSTVTNSEGYFEVVALPIGVYKVSVDHAGFKSTVTQAKKLQINESLRFDITLSVGATNEVVTVEAQVSEVETANPTIGDSVTSRAVVNLPLNGRNVLQLALLQSGVTPANGDAGGGGFSVSGGRTDAVTYLLDGGLNTDLLRNDVVYNPNPDSIAEFRILKNNYTAEYGRNAGGIISVVTKSGTNDLHGSLFDFVRNGAFNANSFFNNKNLQPRDTLRRHQFGATVGGPVTIPHFINGKDRAFFFVSYQGQRQAQTVTSNDIGTFTPAEITGDFSHSAPDGSGGPDPSVVAFLQSHPQFQSNAALAAQGIFDPTKIDPVAQKIVALGVIPTSATGRTSSSASSKDNYNELTGKLDFVISQSDRLSLTVGGTHNQLLQPYGNGNADVPGFDDSVKIDKYFGNIGYTKTFSPYTLNEFRFTAQRRLIVQAVPINILAGSGPKELGININPDRSIGLPSLLFDNSGLALGYDQNGPTTFPDTTYVYSDVFTWIHGKHSWRFGASFSPYQDNLRFAFATSAFYEFGPFGNNTTGNEFADFLVGNPNFFYQGPDAPNNIRTKATSLFAQDEWKIRRNLTLTLGIRYEYNSPKLDTLGRTDGVIPGLQSTRFPAAPLGLVFPGDKGAPRGLYFPDKNNFAPRIGFAWTPRDSSKTSVRGGFGVFYDVINGRDNIDQNGAQPFASFSQFGFTTLPSFSGPSPLQDPYGNAGVTNPFPTASPSSVTDWIKTYGPFNATTDDPFIRTPYVYQYSLSLQHEVAKNLIAEITYAGQLGRKLQAAQFANPMILGTTTRLLNSMETDPTVLSSCSGVDPVANTCPFIGGVPIYRNGGNSTYSSLQSSLTKRVGDTRLGNVYFTLAYTYGHSIDNVSGRANRSQFLAYYNPAVFRASSDYDLRHNISFSGGWDLPFERLWKSAPQRLTKGWSLYPILTWRTGFPLNINAGFPATGDNDPGPSGAGDPGLVNALLKPGVTGVPVTSPSGDTLTYFDGNAFLKPGDPNYQFDSSTPCAQQEGQREFPSPNCVLSDAAVRTYGGPRNSLRGPGRTNLDLSLAKTTQIFERLNAELRLEAFNVFNHTEFNDPNTNVFSSRFGRVTSTFAPRIVQIALRLTF